MPAIQPARLKQRSAELVTAFRTPAAFVRDFHDLLEIYADRTRRPGQAGAPPPLIHTYRTPGPVIRQVIHDLNPLVVKEPQRALVLADALWEEENLECRRLAIEILGMVPPSEVSGLVDRVKTWSQGVAEEEILHWIITKGLARLREADTPRFINLIRDWLSAPETQAMGLRTLPSMIESPHFSNLPLIFTMVTPLVLRSSSELYPFLREVVQALAKRSPNETAFWLRQCLVSSAETSAAPLIRRSMSLFPIELQNELRAALRSKEESRR